MKRVSFDPKNEAGTAHEAHDGPRHMPCRWCGNATPVTVLMHLGARCNPCFQAFLTSTRRPPHHEDLGFCSTPAQREMWAAMARKRGMVAAAIGDLSKPDQPQE